MVFSSFNIRTWKHLNKSAIFKEKDHNRKEIIFQHVRVNENVLSNGKNRYEEINRFRNGDISQHLTIVDIEEIVTSGGYIVDILEGFISDNLEYNPFERFIIDKLA